MEPSRRLNCEGPGLVRAGDYAAGPGRRSTHSAMRWARITAFSTGTAKIPSSSTSLR